MKFAALPWLVATPLLLLGLLTLWVWSAHRGRQTLRAMVASPLREQLLRSVSRARRRWKLALVLVAVTALALALARPGWGRNVIEIERTGVDLIIALDVSRSMLAADADHTNRLTVARTAIGRLVDQLGGDRVGLVVFAGEAYLAAPLTRDHTAFRRALAAADPDAVSEPGSNLGAAIKLAREGFDRASQGPRALLIVSDGEQLQGDALEAARLAWRDGIRVHTAGVGSAVGARVPRRTYAGGGFTRNAQGREVVSRRDDQRLQRISTAGGGAYTRLERRDSAALVEWFQRAAAALPRVAERRTVDEPRERFQWPLAVAFALLCADWLLNDRRRMKTPHLSTTVARQS
ncbi:MAG: VWA domain-containing protein [Verrucomicrobia bacterium]|nr:VWA domain-containing protein [Verrucomicrobiota bacterium]